jgi:hypothetical protein
LTVERNQAIEIELVDGRGKKVIAQLPKALTILLRIIPA